MMLAKLIIRFWKKALYLLITGSTSIFIAACYGMPVGFGSLGNWIIKVKDEENKPIEGLQITVLQFVGNTAIPDTVDIQQTDSSGESSFFLTTYNKDASHRHEAIIHDIDSTENGGFFIDISITKTDSELSNLSLRIKQ